MPNVLTKEYAGLKGWQWAGVGIGGYLAYRAYQSYKAAQAANATTSGLSTAEQAGLGGGTSDVGTSGGTGGGFQGTLAEWLAEALQQFTGSSNYNSAQFYNDLTAWTSGGCVSQSGFGAISNVLQTLGPAPGLNNPITVCATAKQPPAQQGKSAAQDAYKQALENYQAAARGHASGAILQQLMADVLGAQARVTGAFGSAGARAAYVNALTAYRQAASKHANASTLASLYQQVIYTQATYLGHG